MTVQVPELVVALERAASAPLPSVAESRRLFREVSAEHGGGRNPYLVTAQEQSTKLAKNAKRQKQWRQGVVYLAPARLSGVANLCPHSTPECRRTCLGVTAGRLRFGPAQTAQKVRTVFMVRHPAHFVALLAHETRHFARDCDDLHRSPVLRFNGTSDIPLEQIPSLLVLLRGAGIEQFVDYTKFPNRRGDVTSDYYVAASVSERTAPEDVRDGSVLVVGDVGKHESMPDTYNGYPVVDGDDAHGDLRHLDPRDAVVMLRAKGAAKSLQMRERGFVRSAHG